ncbi:helix-turn-helix protein [Mycobacterium sp. BK086]|uniref:helix-turn-helix domain-containing protein n=1 Tax=Mycobacterium sp. BK086 TaxID=2512165 RepID=UPI00105D118F|nr:helix-turn-helix domain-containing protein [Mycobacterium sp. BK086]TDO16928.1 helix-turn-helix protein [Mycobacterium sp. BK086]
MGSFGIILDELLTPEQVAKYRKMTVASLTQERYLGRGPLFIRDGRKIRYRASDLAAYLDANTQEPSS